MNRKGKYFIITAAVALTSMVLSSPLFAQNQSLDENCCFQIWAAGCNLGWSTSLMYYTRERERWLEGPDGTITNNLLRAGRHIQQANMSCNQGPTQAWPAWSQKKYSLEQIVDSLSNNPSSWNRNELSKHLWSTQNWSSPLRVVDTGAQIGNDGTCAEKYFRMGWWTSYIQQTLHMAGESLGNGNPSWENMVHHAKNHMGSLLNTLFEYQNLNPITQHCVSIDTQDLINRISDIQSRDFSSQSLNYMMGGFDWLQPKIQQEIIGGCSRGWRAKPPLYGQEICGDGIDNNGNMLIDEGCGGGNNGGGDKNPALTYGGDCPKQNPGQKSSYKLDTNNNPDDKTYMYCAYFNDGDLESQFPFLNGKKHGVHISYATFSGKPKHPINRKTTYRNGIKHGLLTTYSWCSKGNNRLWYKSGEYLYRNGKKVSGATKTFKSPCYP